MLSKLWKPATIPNRCYQHQTLDLVREWEKSLNAYEKKVHASVPYIKGTSEHLSKPFKGVEQSITTTSIENNLEKILDSRKFKIKGTFLEGFVSHLWTLPAHGTFIISGFQQNKSSCHRNGRKQLVQRSLKGGNWDPIRKALLIK